MTTGFLFEIFNEQRASAVIDRVKSQSIKLRPYQAAAVDSAYAQWNEVRSTLINLATGLGKSICFAETMRRWDVAEQGKILLIAHRTELIFQAVGHARRAGLTCGIEMAGRYANGKEDVIVASVQSLNASQKCSLCFGEGCDMCSNGKVKRFTRFNPRDFGLVTVDEAHHAVATGYRNVLTWFGQNPNQKTLLVTATPKRQDKIGMHNICDSVAYEMDLKTGIDEGWLVPIRQKFVTVEGLDISKVKTSKGDLQQGQLEQAFLGLDEDEERMLHAIVKPTLMEANGRKTIVFASGKEHANKLAACFNANGVEAGVVTDDTDLAFRAELVERYSNGELQVLVNCMCFTEGFDAPKTAIIANCRPTKSEALYLQIIGRGTRPLAGVVDGPETAEARKQAIADSEKSHCIAEGQRVLTDQGLVAIESVTTAMKVWDGVEFVQHCGTIFRGKRRVISYAGLVATPDHEVYVHDQENKSSTKEVRKTFGECAAKQIAIRVTGIGRKEVRETDRRNRRGNSSRMERASNCLHTRRVRLWETIGKRLHKRSHSQGWLPNLRKLVGSPGLAAASMFSSKGSMHKQKTHCIQQVRRTRYRVSVRNVSGNGKVDNEIFGREQGFDIRQNRQRRSLRTRKFAFGWCGSSGEQSKKKTCHSRGARIFNCTPKREVCAELLEETYSQGNDLERNMRQARREGRRERTSGAVLREARVFDIVNAGPRHRFTVEGLLVCNCVVLDFCGNSGEHKLVSVADVLSGDTVDPIDLAQAIAIAKEDGETVDTEELIEKVKQARKEAEDRKEQERIRRLMTSTKADHADYTAVDVNLFAGGKFDSHDSQAEMASDGQKRFLKHLGIDKKQSRHLTRKQASGIIAQAYKKVQNDWKSAMNSATTQAELHQIGRVIKQRESTDYMLRDEKTIAILRTHYKQRREALSEGS